MSEPYIALLFQTTKIQTFSKQFTTRGSLCPVVWRLFQTTKIQTFESNSQQMYERSNQ